MASDAAAGSTYRYDGDRFSALTPVVETCTGGSYRVALAREILDRIGMSDSVPGRNSRQHRRISTSRRWRAIAPC
jgi:hypothetical protein